MRHRWIRLGYGGSLVAVVFASRWFAHHIVAPARYGASTPGPLLWWLLTAGFLLVGVYGVGLPEAATSRSQVIRRGLAATGVSTLAVAALQLVSAADGPPRSALGAMAFLVPAVSLVAWNLSHDVLRWTEQRERVVAVVGIAENGAALQTELTDRIEEPAQLLAVVGVAEAALDGSRRPLEDIARECGATLLVLDRTAQDDAGIVEQVVMLHREGVRVRTLALFYEGWLGKLPVSELAQVSLLFDIGEVHRLWYVRAKRVFDFVLGALGALVLCALLPVVVIANLLANRGPLFFTQERVGKDGVVFTMLKFRTMRPSDSREWTTASDSRITRFGGVLRKSHLDELPQVLNVLRGELSIVGPRPEQVDYVEELRLKLPYYDARHVVRPGLTGWAQVKFGYASSEGDALEKLQYDFFYLRRQSLGFDARIVVRTLREVVGGLGR